MNDKEDLSDIYILKDILSLLKIEVEENYFHDNLEKEEIIDNFVNKLLSIKDESQRDNNSSFIKSIFLEYDKDALYNFFKTLIEIVLIIKLMEQNGDSISFDSEILFDEGKFRTFFYNFLNKLSINEKINEEDIINNEELCLHVSKVLNPKYKLDSSKRISEIEKLKGFGDWSQIGVGSNCAWS